MEFSGSNDDLLDAILARAQRFHNATVGTLAGPSLVHVFNAEPDGTMDIEAAKNDAGSSLSATHVLVSPILTDEEGVGFKRSKVVLDTHLQTPGDTVYLGTAGGFVFAAPGGGALVQVVGYVLTSAVLGEVIIDLN